MCAAFGHENMIAHRGWRLLSDKLAAKGFHVLRFDYPGTGDSSGTEDDPGRLAAWRGSIIAAVDYLRSVSNAEEVILIGLRLGATLALLAAEDLHHVCGVVGLAPIFSGKAYLRELRLCSNAWKEAHLIEVERHSSKGLDVFGERLGEETITELLQIKLLELNIFCKPILVFRPNEDLASVHVLDRLKSGGCELIVRDFLGYADYLNDPVLSVVPQTEFDIITDWCEQFIPKPMESGKLSQASKTVSPSVPESSFLILRDSVETAVRFGFKRNLFGILCCPLDAKHKSSKPVIMLNTGFGRHVGDGRVFTTLSRRLAAEGTTSLRIDLTGFGDSDSIVDSEADPYAVDAFKDVIEAINYLEQIGYSSPVIVGVCSGAFTAFHAAVKEPRIRGIIIVNIQTFLWKQGLPLKVQMGRQRRPFGFYLSATTRLNAWRRLFRGELAAGAILLALCRRPIVAARLLICLNFEKLSGRTVQVGQVSRWFNQLNARGVEVNLLYSDGDPGLAELALWFGRNGRRLRRFRNVSIKLLRKADHALLDYPSKIKFVEMVLGLMK